MSPEQVLKFFSVEFRGKKLMRIKIIKHAEAKRSAVKTNAEKNENVTNDIRKTAETVKFWIDDLRQKRERERRSFNEIFGKESRA